jgi:branched-chain amino acid transport system substrate-binding protein
VRTQSGSLTGFIAVGDQIQAGMEAYVGWANAHGGVNGRPVELVNGNDAGDPNTGLAAAKKLVEQDQIVAMLTVSGASVNAVTPYLEEQRIPVVGSLAPVLGAFVPVHPYVFGTQTPYEYQGSAVAEFLAKQGKNRLAYAGYNTPSGQAFGQGFVDRSNELGREVVLKEFFNQPSTEFTALIGKLSEAKPEAVVWFSSDQEAAAVLKQAQQFAFQTTWLWGPGASTPHLVTLVGQLAEGTYGVSPFAALSSNSSAVQEFKQNVQQYSKVKADLSTYTEFGYLNARAAIDAMKSVKSGDITSVAIRDAVEGLSGDYSLMPKFQLGPSNHLMNTSTQIVQFKGPDLISASDVIVAQLPASISKK